MTIQFDEEKQNRKLDEIHRSEAEALAETLSEKYGVPYVDLTKIGVNTDALKLLPEKRAREMSAFPFSMTGRKIGVAAAAPENPEVLAFVEELKKDSYEPTLFIVSREAIENGFERYKDLSFAEITKAGSLDISNEEVAKFAARLKTTEDTGNIIKETISVKQKFHTSRIMEIILAGAIKADASDIHIEPSENSVRLRYRLDGVLNDITEFDKKTYTLLISRIKLLSGLKLNVRDEAQDGRFSVNIDGTAIEIRTSILPGDYGEAIVLRVLNPKTIALPLEELGIEPKLLQILEKNINRPNGMVLTTGPTGSGKTTTLYAFLKKIYSAEIKIITIEDPIEYHLPGIVQTQADEKNYTFASGLRSAVRQDPDVIMVGEIRDNETADISINASLTGHLVFSTLHTNTAAGTFPRLIELGINPKLISSAVTMTMAQRLIRKICPACKKSRAVTEDEKKLFSDVLKTAPKDAGVPSAVSIFEPVGCPKCNFTGYKGRLGIFEAVLNDEATEKVIINNPSEREIQKAAEPQGILNMQQDGVIKVLRGVTSLKELQRVIDLS